MLNKIKHNLAYKITALVFAILFWFVVYNNDNPIVTIKLTIPITIQNQTSLQSNNLEIINNYDTTIILEVRGRESETEQVNVSDFVINYDFSNITDENIKFIEFSEINYTGDNAINYNVTNDGYIAIEVENIAIKEKNIQIQLLGEPAYGYSIVKTSLTPEKITIKDVASLVEEVSSAIVKVDVEGIRGNTSIRKICEFYDNNGDIIPELNDYLSVDVAIEVARELNVETSIIGILGPDYQVVSYSSYPVSVKISGPEQALSSIDILKTDSISVTEKTEDFTQNASFVNLPIGCNVVGSSNSIDVLVRIEKLVLKTYSFYKSEIDFEYMDSSGQYSYFLLEDRIDIILKGRQVILDQITKEMISPSIDVAEKNDSQSFLPVGITIPEGTKQINYPTAEVKILRNMDISLSVDDVYLINARHELYEYGYVTENIEIKVLGFTEDLALIDKNKLNPTIDVKDLKEGNHKVSLSIDLPSNIEISEQLLVNIILEGK